MPDNSSYILQSIEYVNPGSPVTGDLFEDADEVNRALAETARSIRNTPEVPHA